MTANQAAQSDQRTAARRRKDRWLRDFRRSFRFLRPHRRPLIMGLIAAIGVGFFYAFSFSSVVPMLKVIFADHETLVDWIDRAETQRRLGVAITSDLPDDPAGLSVDHVRDGGLSDSVLNSGDRIIAINGERMSSYELMERLAATDRTRLENVTVASPDDEMREVTLRLKASPFWYDPLQSVASMLPSGKGRDARLTMLAVVMGLLVLASILGGLCRIANEGLIAASVQRAMHDLRSNLADHVIRLPLDWHSRHPHGDVLGRFATDISKVEVGMTTLFGKTIREPIKAMGVLTVTILIDWKLLLVALIGLPIGAIVLRTFGRAVKKAQRRASQSWGRLLDHLGEKLAGIRVVKAYNMESAEARRFESEGRELTRAQTHIEYVDAATKPVLETLAMIAVAAFVLYGGSRVFSQQLEPHLFFAAVVCLGGVFEPFRKLGNVNNRLQAADASARRLFELLDLHREEHSERTAALPALPAMRESIAFEHVSFAYPSNPDKLVIDDVSFTVRKGQVVAVVGGNGSGKTTLMSLLMRFYEPNRGRILIDDNDIAQHSLLSLRRQIGLVTQDSVVFSDTVRGNIAYGDDALSTEAIERAARLAHAEDFVQSLRTEQNGSARRGYDASISNRTLSGGQRQRLSLARAIHRDPPILILDEATSQVDSESERKIQEALEDITPGRTTFIIAHRYSTISRADVILVLDAGRLVAHGRHDELLEQSPFYVTLCETQFAGTKV